MIGQKSLSVLIFSLLLVNMAAAGTIYTWTDADGVRRYSNAQPPEGAENVRTLDEVQGDQSNSGQTRQAYDRMVEEASQEADRHFQEQAEKKAAAQQAERQRQQEKQASMLEQQRQQLQQQIESIKNRGLSPTFSAGQKAYLIEQIQNKIDEIDNKLKADANR